MNDDLKAYVDGELPPDAADRLRANLEADPALALQGEEFQRLSAALRALPEPMPVGQAATLEALARRRPLWRFDGQLLATGHQHAGRILRRDAAAPWRGGLLGWPAGDARCGFRRRRTSDG